MVLALSADVVGKSISDLGKGLVSGGIEHLSGARRGRESARVRVSRSEMADLLCVEVKGQAEVVEDTLGEGGAEELLALLDVSKEDEAVWVHASLGGGVKHGASLEDELVGAEVVALNESKLVLVRGVERASSILHQAEVQALHALGGRVSAIVAGREKLSTTEAELNVVCARSKNGLVAVRVLASLFGT